MPKVQELRDVADWQRWANVGIQEQLCEKMEALKALEDPEEIAKQVRELQQQWRQAADVPRAQGEALWRRFKAAHDEAWTRCEAHFAAQAEARAENLAKKIALCERAEALADSTNWIQTADEIKKLQAEWKTIGPVSRGQEKAIWERFRAACDRFFTRRHADLAERKTVWAENLAKKEALCAQGRGARASRPTGTTAAAEIKRLQAEWKTIGPVKKSRSEAIWQRFRGAVRSLLRALRAAPRHRARRARRGAREAICRGARSAGAPSSRLAGRNRAAGPGRAPSRSDGHGAGAARPMAAGARRARRRSRSRRGARRALRRGVQRASSRAGRRCSAAPISIPTRTASGWKRSSQRMEDLGEVARRAGVRAAPTPRCRRPTRLAAMLKEALAANTIGGKVDDDSRFRAADDDVRQAQAALVAHRAGARETRRALADRFSARFGDSDATRQAQARSAPGRWSGGQEVARSAHDHDLPTYWLLNLDQLDVEHEHAVRRALALVGELLRNPEARLLAFDHQLQPFGPSRDHAVERRTSPARRAPPSCRTSCRRSSSRCSAP